MKTYPTVMHLYPSMRCQLNCKYCYVDSVNKDLTEISLEEYRNLIGQALEFGIKAFDIAGGEPFLYQHIIELLKLINELGGTSKVVSNGYYLDRYIPVLKENKELIDELHISLDSVDQKVHDSIRGCQGLFKKVIENIALYKDNAIGKLRINYVLQKGTYLELEDMLDFIEGNEIDGIDIQYVEDVGEKTQNGSFALDCSELINAIERIIDWKTGNNAKTDILIALPGYIYSAFSYELKRKLKVSKIKTIYFPGLLQNNYFSHAVIVKQNGDITGATALFNDEKWICGNVRKDSLKEVITHNFSDKRMELENLISERMKDKCTGCMAKRLCHGSQVIQQNNKCSIKEELASYMKENNCK